MFSSLSIVVGASELYEVWSNFIQLIFQAVFMPLTLPVRLVLDFLFLEGAIDCERF